MLGPIENSNTNTNPDPVFVATGTSSVSGQSNRVRLEEDITATSDVSKENVLQFIDKQKIDINSVEKLKGKLSKDNNGNIELELYQLDKEFKEGNYYTKQDNKRNILKQTDPNKFNKDLPVFFSSVIHWEVSHGGETSTHSQRVFLRAEVPRRDEFGTASQYLEALEEAKLNALLEVKAKRFTYKSLFGEGAASQGRDRAVFDQFRDKIYVYSFEKKSGAPLKNRNVIKIESHKVEVKSEKVFFGLAEAKSAFITTTVKTYNLYQERAGKETRGEKTEKQARSGVVIKGLEEVATAESSRKTLDEIRGSENFIDELKSKDISFAVYSDYLDTTLSKKAEDFVSVSTFYSTQTKPNVWKRSAANVTEFFTPSVAKSFGLRSSWAKEIVDASEESDYHRDLLKAPEEGFSLKRLNLRERELFSQRFRGFTEAKEYHLREYDQALENYQSAILNHKSSDEISQAEKGLKKAKENLDHFAGYAKAAHIRLSQLDVKIELGQLEDVYKETVRKIVADLNLDFDNDGYITRNFSPEEVRELKDFEAIKSTDFAQIDVSLFERIARHGAVAAYFTAGEAKEVQDLWFKHKTLLEKVSGLDKIDKQYQGFEQGRLVRQKSFDERLESPAAQKEEPLEEDESVNLP